MLGSSSHTRTSLMSDESEIDLEDQEEDRYHRKFQLLLDRCETIQQDNERIVNRLQRVKKLIARRKKETKYLQQRLDAYGDDWRNAPPEIDINQDVKPTITACQSQTTIIKTEKVIKTENDKSKSTKKPTKRKGSKTEKSEKDPNAPKRPANPFFQFCQEQRQILMEQLNAELKPGEAEPSKQELTRQLAVKWKSLSGQDKQIYVDMYERSKEKYAVEMSQYNCKN